MRQLLILPQNIQRLIELLSHMSSAHYSLRHSASTLHAVTRIDHILTMTDVCPFLRACTSHVLVGKSPQQSSAYEVVPGFSSIAPGAWEVADLPHKRSWMQPPLLRVSEQLLPTPATERFQRRPQLVRRFFSHGDQGTSDFDVRFEELALFHYFGFGELVQQLTTRS